VAIWYILWLFDIFSVLVCWKKKNLASLKEFSYPAVASGRKELKTALKQTMVVVAVQDKGRYDMSASSRREPAQKLSSRRLSKPYRNYTHEAAFWQRARFVQIYEIGSSKTLQTTKTVPFVKILFCWSGLPVYIAIYVTRVARWYIVTYVNFNDFYASL
jgi:hypothetical protein